MSPNSPWSSYSHVIVLASILAIPFATARAQSQPSIPYFTVSPQQILQGQAVHVEWIVTDADRIELEPLGLELTTPTGSMDVFPDSSVAELELVASNEVATVRASRSIVVTYPAIHRFEVDATAVFPGASVRATWDVTPGGEMRIDPGGIVVGSARGSVDVPVDAPDLPVTMSVTAGAIEVRRSVGPIGWRPPELEFLSVPDTVQAGATTYLWIHALGHEELTADPSGEFVEGLDGEIYFGTVFVEDTSGTITATNRAGSRTLEYSVVVEHPDAPPLVELHPLGNLATHYAGFPFPFRVSVQNSTRAVLEPVGLEFGNGVHEVEVPVLEDTEFRLVAENAFGTAEDAHTITVDPPKIVLFTTDTPEVYPGTRVTIRARFAGAITGRVDPVPGELDLVEGERVQIISFQTVIEDTTPFRLTVTNPAGSRDMNLVVSVLPPVVGLFRGPETAIVSGETAALEWNVSGTDGVGILVDGDIIHEGPAVGSFDVAPATTTVYELRASNGGGTTVAHAVISVLDPRILHFDADPDGFIPGETVTVSWSTEAAVAVRMLRDGEAFAEDLPAEGEMEVALLSAAEFELVAATPSVEVRRSLLLEPRAIVIDSFTADPMLVPEGGTTTLSWSARGTGRLELVGYGPQPNVGQLEVELTSSHWFELLGLDGETVVDRARVRVSAFDVDESTVRWDWRDDGTDARPRWLTNYVPFDAYVVVEQPAGGIESFTLRTVVPPEVFVLSSTVVDENATVHQGHPDWVVDTAGCLDAPLSPLLKFTFLLLSPSLGWLDIGPVDGAPGPLPSFVDCSGMERAATPGDPLPLFCCPVSLESVELDLARVERGVQLRWSLHDSPCARTVHVFRTIGDSTEGIAELTGAEACGPWTDHGVPPGARSVSYRVRIRGESGVYESTDVSIETPIERPRRTRLLANAPNPFNPSTEIRFELAAPGRPRIDVYDAAGRRVRAIDPGDLPAGRASVPWDGRDGTGRLVSSGVYLVRLTAADGISTRRIVLVK